MSDSFAGVRIAREADEDRIFHLLVLLHQENAMSPMDEAKVRAMIQRGTRRQGGIIGLIDGPDGAEATVGMALSQWWYTSAWHLEEMWSFVHPDYRHSDHAKKLIGFAKWTADQLSVPLLMGILTQHRVAAKIRLYQREIPQVGALFLHGAKIEGAINQRGDYKEIRERTRKGERPIVALRKRA